MFERPKHSRGVQESRSRRLRGDFKRERQYVVEEPDLG